MDEIKHYWNLVKHISKYDNESSNYLQMYYVQCSRRNLDIELPKQHFGPSKMCSHCGTLWSKTEPHVKLNSGKAPSKSVKKIIKASKEGNRVSKFQASLVKKSLNNSMNKIIMRCTVCSKNTEIRCTKPERLRPTKNEINDTPVQKKKKKKKKDKTAGLNLSFLSSPKVEEQKYVNSSPSTPLSSSEPLKIKKGKTQLSTPILKKAQKFNAKKLNNILNRNKIEKSGNSLSNFLQELY